MDLRDFDPVEPLAELPATLRQTALAKMSTCHGPSICTTVTRAGRSRIR
jgi:hypothetical protein